MPDFLHIQQQTAGGAENKLALLPEMLPAGSGFVKVNPDRSLTLETPSGTGSGAPMFREELTVSATNVLSQLSYTPRPNTVVLLHVRGQEHSTLSADFTVAGRTVTIANGGYSIQVGWQVEAEYYTDDTITPPSITSFAPASASVGGTVVITGAAFNGVQSVLIGGVNQTSYVVNSATQITVTLVAGAYPLTPSNVTVTTASGTATLGGFTYLDPTPTITNLAPLLTAIGNEVVITGTNFTSVSAVRFGGTNAASFVVDSLTQIRAIVADTGAAGTVQVTTPNGTATSSQSITLDAILSFPRSGRIMTANSTVINTLTYTALASSFAFAGAEGFRAFNFSLGDWWLASADINEWLEIQLPRAARVRRYTIGCPGINQNHLPRTWQLQGWNGSAWVTLDTRTAQTLNPGVSYDYTFTNNTYYSRYRLLVNASQLAGWAIAVGELTLHAA